MKTSIKQIDRQRRREYLAKYLNTIGRDYSSKTHGNDLTMLGPMIEALTTATAAKAIRQAAPSLLLGLKTALLGIESEKCAGGVIGKVLSSAVRDVTDSVESIFLAKEDVGSRQLFALLLQTLILATISVVWKLEQLNLSYAPNAQIDEVERLRKKVFDFELILLLILRTGIIELILKNAAETCGIPINQQDLMAKFLKALVFILALLTASKGQQAILKMLVLDLRDYLKTSLIDIQAFINKMEEAGNKSEKSTAISIYLQQALASLQDEDFDTLQKAYQGMLDEIQALPELMEEDIQKVRVFSNVIYNAFSEGAEMNQTTVSLMI